jgi:hypothetical protein
MENKKLREFENDAAADQAVASVTSTLKNVLRSVNSKKDFARVAEALMNFMINNKDLLKSNVPNDPNYKQALIYLNKMQSEKPENNAGTEKPVAQK